MADLAELIDSGVLAYVTGKIPEALAIFNQVLKLDPENSKARGYLILVQATHPNAVPASPPPPPAPPPPSVAAQPEPAPPAPVARPNAVPAAERIVEPPRAAAPAAAPVPEPAAAVPVPEPAAAVPVPEPAAAVPVPEPVAAAPVAEPAAAAPAPVPAPPEPKPVPSHTAVPLPAPPPNAAREREAPAPAPVPNPVPLPATAPAARPAPAPLHAQSPEAHVEREDDYAPSPWDEGPATSATIVLSDDASDGLDLAAVAEKSDLRPLVPQGQTAPVAVPGAPPNDVDLWLRAAKELFALGDFTGSLELIEKILTVDPDHGEARDYLRQNEATLVSMYESKLGPLHAIPRLAIKPEEVMWLNLDHRAGFLLAQIDGTVDYEGLFAVSGLPRLDTARILANLIADGVVRA